MEQLLNVLALGLMAGLGTGLGGLIAILRRPGRRTFGLLMGVTAGVMITLSFLDLVNEAWAHGGFLTATLGFGAGALFMFAIDVLVPHIRFEELEVKDGTPGGLLGEPPPAGPPQTRRRFRRRGGRPSDSLPVDSRLFRTGILIAIGIAIHNAPEGIAVGAGFMHTPQFGIFIAVAIALHNIPEGIATALPLLKSGVSRWRCFRTALLSGMVEPVGALIAALALNSFQSLIPAALAFAGGVMTFLTLDELIPIAREHGHQHFTALGIIFGAVAVFLLSGIFGL